MKEFVYNFILQNINNNADLNDIRKEYIYLKNHYNGYSNAQIIEKICGSSVRQKYDKLFQKRNFDEAIQTIRLQKTNK